MTEKAFEVRISRDEFRWHVTVEPPLPPSITGHPNFVDMDKDWTASNAADRDVYSTASETAEGEVITAAGHLAATIAEVSGVQTIFIAHNEAHTGRAA